MTMVANSTPLPKEIWDQIFCCLSSEEINCLPVVCKLFSQIVGAKEFTLRSKRGMLILKRNISNDLFEPIITTFNSWGKVTALLASQNTLCVGLSNGMIQVRNSANLNSFFALIGNKAEGDEFYDIGHSQAICSFYMKNDSLYSVCDKGLCIEWDLNTGASILVYQNPQEEDPSPFIVLGDKLLVGGSTSTTEIEIYSLTSFEWEQRLIHHERIYAIYEADSLFATSVHSQLYIWNKDDFTLIKNIEKRTALMTSAAITDSYAVAAIESEIEVYDIHTGECIHTLQRHENSVTLLLIQENLIFSTSVDDTLCIWDVDTGELLKQVTAEGVFSKARAMTADNGILYLLTSESHVVAVDFLG